MIMKRFFTLFCLLFSICITTLKAEEFIAKRGSYEKNGQKIEIKNLSGLPPFYADFHSAENVVKIKCSAGNLVLKKGNYFYAYRGVHKGLIITATAHVENNIIKSIIYEEWDKANDIKAIISYYKK